jgi:hypothetical protein
MGGGGRRGWVRVVGSDGILEMFSRALQMSKLAYGYMDSRSGSKTNSDYEVKK